MTDEHLREMFREMREEPVPLDSLVRVRTGVMDKIARRRAWWTGALAAAAVCALLLVFVLRIPRLTHLPERKPDPPAIAAAVESAVIRSTPRQAHRQKRAAWKASRIPVTIRIETPDPDVVILLVGN